MKTRLFFLLSLCLLCLYLLVGAGVLVQIQKPGTKAGVVTADPVQLAALQASVRRDRVANPEATSQRIRIGYGKLPLSFESLCENSHLTHHR